MTLSSFSMSFPEPNMHPHHVPALPQAVCEIGASFATHCVTSGLPSFPILLSGDSQENI